MPPLGDVETDTGEAQGIARIVIAAPTLRRHPAQIAIGHGQTIFGGETIAAAHRLFNLGANAVDIVGMDVREEQFDRLPGLGILGIDAIEPREPRIGTHPVFGNVPVPGADAIGGVQRKLQPCLALAQPRLGGRAFGHVIRFDEDVGGDAIGVLQRLIDEIEQARFDRAATVQHHRALARPECLAAGKHLVEQFDKALPRQFGQGGGDRPAQ